MEVHRLSELIFPWVRVITGVTLGRYREAVLGSSAMKLLKQLEKILSAM